MTIFQLDTSPQAAEARVRAFLDAQTDEDTETGKPTPELAWAVPSDGSGLRTLYTADLHRLMAALSALRRGRA